MLTGTANGVVFAPLNATAKREAEEKLNRSLEGVIAVSLEPLLGLYPCLVEGEG